MKALKIYIATSWKMAEVAKMVARAFRDDGHEVDCFCDPSSGRYVFHWSEFVEEEEDLQNYDALSFIDDPRVQRAFKEDKKHLDWADVVVMIYPCGNSAHLEAGYGKGQGKDLFIWGTFPKGKFDVMLGFADGIFRASQLHELRSVLQKLRAA